MTTATAPNAELVTSLHWEIIPMVLMFQHGVLKIIICILTCLGIAIDSGSHTFLSIVFLIDANKFNIAHLVKANAKPIKVSN